ncbi:MAG: hypothetical protein OEW19_17530 [Acidobacteriota bacterium]|nr:hypothetical protein [Acidobacteriota bacterium]
MSGIGRDAGQFIFLPAIVVDSRGDLYTVEVGTGRRVQKFVRRQNRSARSIRYTAAVDTTGLPGADLVAQGLRDIAAGRETAAALLVLIGAPRLRRLGLVVPSPPTERPDATPAVSPEHRLYALLAQSDADSAHSRYNALIRTLVSFERAGECVR